MPESRAKQNERLLLEYSKNPSPELMGEIVKLNEALVYYFSKNYSTNLYDKEDLASHGKIGLIKAINTFDYTKGYSFATYAGNCILNEIRMAIRKLKNRPLVVSLEDELREGITIGDTIESPDSDPQNLIKDNYLYDLVSNLEPRYRVIMELFYGFNCERMNQLELSQNVGISQPQLSRIVVKQTSIIGKKYKNAISGKTMPEEDSEITKYNDTIDGIKPETYQTIYQFLTESGKKKLLNLVSNRNNRSKYNKQFIQKALNYQDYCDIKLNQLLNCRFSNIDKYVSLASFYDRKILEIVYGKNFDENHVNKYGFKTISDIDRIVSDLKKAYKQETEKTKKLLCDMIGTDQDTLLKTVESLTLDERNILYRKYGRDLRKNNRSSLSKEESRCLYNVIFNKIKSKIDRDKKAKPLYEKLGCTKEEYYQILSITSQKHRDAIFAKYGEDIDNPSNNLLHGEEQSKYYSAIQTFKKKLDNLRNRDAKSQNKLNKLVELAKSDPSSMFSLLLDERMIYRLKRYFNDSELDIIFMILGINDREYSVAEISEKTNLNSAQINKLFHLFMLRYRKIIKSLASKSIDEYKEQNPVLEKKKNF